MSRKIKISFDVRNTWSRGDFRELMRMLKNTDDIQLYIITDTEPPAHCPDDLVCSDDYIDSIAAQLEIPGERVLVDNKLIDIEDENIDIHFDSNNSDVEEINAETDTVAILVIQEVDTVRIVPWYIEQFNRALQKIVDGTND